MAGQIATEMGVLERVSKQTWCLMSTETIRLIRDGEKEGKGVWRRGKREDYIPIAISLHCHHRNDSCFKMGSDESRFNVSLIVRDKVARPCPQTAIFEEKGEPKRIRTEVPLLTSLRLTARPNRLKLRGGRWWDRYTEREAVAAV